MLIFTRKKDDRPIVGNDIETHVLRIGRDNVRLGVKAPRHVSIYRHEIYEESTDATVAESEPPALEPEGSGSDFTGGTPETKP